MKTSKISDLFNKKKTRDNYYKYTQPTSLSTTLVEKNKSIVAPSPAPATKIPVKEIGANQYVYNNKVYNVPTAKPQINNKRVYPGNDKPRPDGGAIQRGTMHSERPGNYDPNYRAIPDYVNTANTLADKALKGEKISDAEGLKRASQAPDGIYIYGDTLFASGTRGNFLGHEWQQNMEHIAKPIVKGLVTNNIDKITSLGAASAPELAPAIGLVGGALSIGKTQMGPEAQKETQVNIQALDRYKNAVKAMDANPQVKKAVGFSVGGMTVLELKNKYKDLTGNVYGTPYTDTFAKEKIKDQLDTEREIRNAHYGNSLLNQPAKFVDNKAQDIVEKSLGLDKVQTMKETGINRFRQAGDLLTALDNSAITSVNIGNIFNPIKAHSYTDQASQNFTASSSNAFGRINPDNSISLTQ